MLADSSLERCSLAQSQTADTKLKDATNRRRWIISVVVVWQLELGFIGQQSRITIIACSQRAKPIARLWHEVNVNDFEPIVNLFPSFQIILFLKDKTKQIVIKIISSLSS